MKRIPRWFANRLKTIMAHNDYTENMVKVAECEKQNKWTPTDLILREWYNNGGGSSKGFLGISRTECKRCYQFIKDNQETLRNLNYYSENGYNNWGINLWTNWNVH